MSYKLPTPATQGTELLLKLDKNTSTFHIKYGFLYSLQIPRARIAENVPQYGCGGLGNCGAPSLFRNSDFQSLGHCVSECSAVNNKTIPWRQAILPEQSSQDNVATTRSPNGEGTPLQNLT